MKAAISKKTPQTYTQNLLLSYFAVVVLCNLMKIFVKKDIKLTLYYYSHLINMVT